MHGDIQILGTLIDILTLAVGVKLLVPFSDFVWD